MNRELCAEEQHRQRTRDKTAVVALSLWAGGAYLQYLGWRTAEALPDRWDDIAVTAICLITFFYVFALWPILIAVDKLFRGPRPSPVGGLHDRHDHVIHYHGDVPERWDQDGDNLIQDANSPIGSSRETAGGVSSSGPGR